ncbi:uncharacterized protein LOC131329877 [Rhododendron vialii]|uniref:uncharacterized protein LOC131329877 n=1 Tax=Rhododendron vialii TaxID=182163 RepID=UPI00265EDC81|nr:uncharacterized protein LOC131329877 [Rhododendron vialii]
MTIADYEAEFTNLEKFGSHAIDIDKRKACKFEDGLIPGIRNVVKPLRLPTYADVLDRALIVEQGREDVKKISESKKRKNRQNTGKVDQRGTLPACATCGKNHSGNGHIQRDYPKKLTGANAMPIGNNVKNPTGQKMGTNQKQGKAFALTLGDPRNTESVVAGTILICSTPAYVLFDLGSTHSFIASQFALKLSKSPEPLAYELLVSMPLNSSTICKLIYRECDVKFAGKKLIADLISMPIDHFDAILGMDWLSNNGVTINCKNKSIVFRNLGLDEFRFIGERVFSPPYCISAARAQRLLKKGCEGYYCSIVSSETKKETLESIPVVQDFSEVFPEDLLVTPMDKEIEFSIDLEPDIQPISKAPYRMALAKLKELKVQLQELLEKGFIRPS